MTLAARWTGLGATLLIVVGLAACAPEPAPTPTPTGFASEEEAFAAAEATYRAYVEAGNQKRRTNDVSPQPTEFLTGEALTAEMKSRQHLADEGVALIGDIRISAIRRMEATSTSATIGACLDVSATQVVDSTGADVTPTTRDDYLGLTITAVWSADGALISSTVASDEEC